MLRMTVKDGTTRGRFLREHAVSLFKDKSKRDLPGAKLLQTKSSNLMHSARWLYLSASEVARSCIHIKVEVEVHWFSILMAAAERCQHTPCPGDQVQFVLHAHAKRMSFVPQVKLTRH